MRPLFFLVFSGAALGCSAESFVAPSDAAPNDASAAVDGTPSDAGSAIEIVNRTSLLQVNQVDPVSQLTPLPKAGNAIIVV
jgi:hypothetical protein